MVGSLDGAKAALNGDGTLIGEGEFRRVRRIGDVVYKLQKNKRHATNEVEFHIAESSRGSLPHFLRIPQVTLHEVGGELVIAMPFVHGVAMRSCPTLDGFPCEDNCAACLPSDVLTAIAAITPDGISIGNTLRDGDIYTIIDLDMLPSGDTSFRARE